MDSSARPRGWEMVIAWRSFLRGIFPRMTLHQTEVPGPAASEALDPPVVSDQARAMIDTPALVVDIDRVDAAIARMASGMAERGVALRPHAKTHKSIEVGRRQIAAGAAGLTVGTIGEAEVFATGGLDDLFIAYPLVPLGPKAARLRALARTARLRLGVDSVVGAHAIADALGDDVERVSVLVEVDFGRPADRRRARGRRRRRGSRLASRAPRDRGLHAWRAQLSRSGGSIAGRGR